VALRACPELV